MQLVSGVSLITVRPVLVQLIKHIPLSFQVSFTFGADVVSKFLNRHDLDLICRAHQVLILTLSDVSKVFSPSDYVHCPFLSYNQCTSSDFIDYTPTQSCYTRGKHGTQHNNNKVTQHNPSRLSRTDTSFSPRGSWSLCSQPPTTVESSTMPAG